MKNLSKSAEIFFAMLLCVFTLVILLALAVIIAEKITGCTFFVNETFCIYRISPIFIAWLAGFCDACTALIKVFPIL